jgi:putative copper resistance protein D
LNAAFAIVRALHFASLMAVFGASALLSQAREIMMGDAKLYRPLFVASLVALATAALWLCFVAAEMSGGTLFDMDVVAAVVAKSVYGNVFILRFALLLWLCVLCLVGSHTIKTVVAGVALALLGLVSHAAAAGAAQYTYARAAVDALHLLCAGFWVGGLVVLTPEVLAKPRDMPRLIALLKLFSRWGVVSVALLIAAGTLNGVFILDMPGMPWNGAYVTWLAIKIVLAAVMVALALTNRFGVLPGLERGEREAGETIPLTVIAELSCALLILLIVGFLGLTAPMAM